MSLIAGLDRVFPKDRHDVLNTGLTDYFKFVFSGLSDADLEKVNDSIESHRDLMVLLSRVPVIDADNDGCYPVDGEFGDESYSTALEKARDFVSDEGTKFLNPNDGSEMSASDAAELWNSILAGKNK